MSALFLDVEDVKQDVGNQVLRNLDLKKVS